MEDVSISKFRAQVVRAGSTPASPGFVVSEGQNPVDPSGSGQNHLPVTIGSPANGLAVTDAQILTIDKAQIFAGTASQFVKGDGTLDSTAYGTGSVTSVALTMPTAFSVGGSPITTAGTLAVTATGTTSQYIRGDGSLATFPALTGFVPYTGATADVNLGTHDLAAERGTFANNGSSDTLTVNHTSGSGYGIIVTKGGANEALYVSKTSGSGNAMTVVGGRTSLVDLALSSVTNTAGDFLTLSGGVVHKRTAAQTLTDIGGQAALTNPVTGTGTTNYLPKFTGSTTIGNSQVFDDGTNVGIGTITPGSKFDVTNTIGTAYDASNTLVSGQTMRVSNLSTSSSIASTLLFIATGGGGGNGLGSISGVNTGTGSLALTFGTRDSGGSVTERMRIRSTGQVGIGTTTPERKFVVSNGGAEGLEISTGTGSTTIISYNRSTSAFIPLVLQEGTGPVIIGTTSNNGERLQVNGKATALALDIISSSGVGSSTASGLARFITAGTTTAISVGQANSARRLDISSYNVATTGVELYLQTLSSHAIVFNTNSIDRVWISNGGNVGINTDSPTTRLHVEVPTGTDQVARFSRGPGNAGDIMFGLGDYGGGYQARMGANQLAFEVNRANGAGLTTGTTAMFINSSGNVLIGVSTNDAVGGITIRPTGTTMVFNSLNTAPTIMSFQYNGAVAGSITRTTTNTAYNIVSDYRLKTDLKDFNGLNLLNKIKTYDFAWKIDKSRMFGVLAHELQEVVNYAVLGNKNAENPQQVDYSKLVPIMIKAIQELKQQIDTLKN
jgi:hypothetical protein